MKKNKKEEVQEEILEEALEAGQEIEVLDAPNQELKEVQDRYQRTLAEFDNYRKRTMKEMSARYNDGISYVCEKLIPMVDNFERALGAQEDKEDNFYKGVAMIARQFEGILSDLGINPIELQPGDKFDPNFHNAVAHVEDENFGQNEVADVLQKGYIHKDKVLRHSMVRVAN